MLASCQFGLNGWLNGRRRQLLLEPARGVEPAQRLLRPARPEHRPVLHAGAGHAPQGGEVHAAVAQGGERAVEGGEPEGHGGEDGVWVAGGVGEDAFVRGEAGEVGVEVDGGFVDGVEAGVDDDGWRWSEGWTAVSVWRTF